MTAQRSVSSSASTKRPISPVVSLPTSRKASQQSTPAAQPADLSTLLGAHLSITIDDNTHQGYLYAYDLGMLVLETPHKSEWAPGSAPLSDRPKSDFNLYKASNIKSVSVLSGGDSKAVSSVKDVDFGWVSQREQQEVRKEEERLKRLPPKGVSRLGAEVHNALSKTMPVRWSDTSLVVLESILIVAPYDAGSCKIGADEANSATGRAKLERVQKVLGGEREKIFQAMPELKQGG